MTRGSGCSSAPTPTTAQADSTKDQLHKRRCRKRSPPKELPASKILHPNAARFQRAQTYRGNMSDKISFKNARIVLPGEMVSGSVSLTHAPAHIDLDLESLGADWYVGNCHKWLMAPKGSAFLWTHPSKQAVTHPTTISHGYPGGYLAEFAWTGTRDPTPFLCVPAAIDFHLELGGKRLRDRNKALAC